jgi:hypothetical protein
MGDLIDEQNKLALAAASVVMAFAANSAKAAIVYAPVTPINVSVGVGKTGNETINFNLAGDSVINAAEVLLKNTNTTSAFKVSRLPCRTRRPPAPGQLCGLMLLPSPVRL